MSGLPDAHEDASDVVLAALLVGQLDELARRLVAVLFFEVGLELGDVVDVPMQPVRGEQELVAGEELEHEGVDLDALVDPDRARDRVLLRDLVDLLLGQAPAADELVVDGVVLGDLLDLAVAAEVDAAVADVGHEPVRAGDEKG